jgi:hypothetical protein
MAHQLALIGLPLLFLADYVAIVVWLLRTSGNPGRGIQFGLRSLLVGTTLAAIHLGMITAFMSDK